MSRIFGVSVVAFLAVVLLLKLLSQLIEIFELPSRLFDPILELFDQSGIVRVLLQACRERPLELKAGNIVENLVAADGAADDNLVVADGPL